MRLLIILICLLTLSGCSGKTLPEELVTGPDVTVTEVPEPVISDVETVVTLPAPAADPVSSLLTSMTLEEKVGQLFLARCNAETALSDIANYHLGGFVLFAVDFENEDTVSLTEKLSGYQAAAKIPLLLAVDEEGGTVTRVSRFEAFRSRRFPSPRETLEAGGMDWVIAIEDEKAALLSSLGLNVNIGPVCDITTDPAAFLYDRSLGQDPNITGEFVSRTVKAMSRYSLGSVLKHFPGYGNNEDTHVGIAVDSRSLSELEQWDLIPFSAGIEAGSGCILVSHTIVEALDVQYPASLSPAVHTYLRETMGFDGVILTDDLVMQAITDRYGAGEAAVLAVLAGNDLLCSTEYALQYEAVLTAVEDGRISQEVLNQAVQRVLQWKQTLGLLTP